MPPSDPNLSWLHALYQRQPALSLAPLDLCFLVALQRRAQELGLAALDADAGLKAGLQVHAGKITHAGLAQDLGMGM